MKTTLLAAAAASLILPFATHAAPLQIINEDMSSTESAFDSFFVSDDDSDGNLSISVSSSASGGNPDDLLDVIHFHDPVAAPDGNPGGYLVQSIHNYNLFSWDPVADGEIFGLDFSVDVRTDSNIGSVFFTVGQGGGGSIAGFQSLALTGDWKTISGSLATSDFSSINFVDGGPLIFGFGFLSNSDGFGSDDFGGEQFAASFDNFQVSVTIVPVPAAAWLMASGLAGLAVLARRRSASA